MPDRRDDLLRGVEQQLLALLTLPGRPVERGQVVQTSALTGPRHLFRVLSAVLQDGDAEPLVSFDHDGDVQCQWFCGVGGVGGGGVGGAVVTLAVEERGAAVLWAVDADDVELAYAEWAADDDPRVPWAAVAPLLRRSAVPVAQLT